MQDEFEKILEELNSRRKEKNQEFYSQVLRSDYGNGDYRLPSPTRTLVDKKKKGLQNKVNHSIKMTYDHKLQDLQAKRTSVTNPDLINQSKKYKVDRHLDVNVGLAQKDPLAFIENVLAHHQ